jgi:vancomycin resistance protein YoaR
MSATLPVDRVASIPIDPRRVLLSRTLARKLTGLLAILALFTVAGALGLVLYGTAHAGRIHQGVHAGGIALGGLSPEDGRVAIEAAWSSYAESPLTLQGPDASFGMTPAEMGFSLDADETIARAMAYGRDGSVIADSRQWARSLVRGVELPIALDLDPAAANIALNRIALQVVRLPADARLDFPADGSVAIVPDRPGIAIDTSATLSAFANTVGRLESGPVPLAVTFEQAARSASDLAPALGAAQALAGKPIVVSSDDQRWHLPASGLADVLTVEQGGAALGVNRPAIEGMVRTIAGQVNRPLADARVIVDDGRLTAVPGGSGVVVDVDASVGAIADALLSGATSAELAFVPADPAVTTAMARAAAIRGEAMLDGGLSLKWKGGAAVLDRTDLLRALTISVDPAKSDPFIFGLDEQQIAATLEGIAAGFDQPMVNARFRLVDGKVSVAAPERTGRTLDLDKGVDDVLAAFGSGTSVTLDVRTEVPKWTVADAARIKIGNDVLGEGGTYYGDSSVPRRQNVELAAMLESGWLVAPGEEFSYAENIGPVEESTGFVTGYGIIEQAGEFTTSPVVGGGICQVSTTIFHSAFWAGLPFTERWAHPYYLPTYSGPPTGLPGLDAMVNIDPIWTLDLKFRNTTGNWIAVIVVADGQNLWSKIVGTDPEWDVAVAEPVITNRVTPDAEMLYVDSPELPLGQEMMVENAADGFDASITRTVTKGGEVIDRYTVESSFTPSRNRTLRGTGEPTG